MQPLTPRNPNKSINTRQDINTVCEKKMMIWILLTTFSFVISFWNLEGPSFLYEKGGTTFFQAT